MSIVAEEYDYVGVDCHAATHTFCVLDTTSGKIEDTSTFPVTGAGFVWARAWIERRMAYMGDREMRLIRSHPRCRPNRSRHGLCRIASTAEMPARWPRQIRLQSTQNASPRPPHGLVISHLRRHATPQAGRKSF